MSSPNITLGNQTMEILLFNTGPTPAIGASVLYANPTATAYVLTCLNASDTAECGTYNLSVTVGNWAPKTSGSSTTGMATGIYDAYNEIPSQSAKMSIHCAMDGTVPGVCTSTENIGYDGRGATATATVITSPASTYSPISWSYQTVSLVGGMEKLAAATTAPTYPTTTSMSSSSGSGSHSAGATATSSSHPTGGAVAAAASASTSTTKSSGASAYGPGMGSMALAAVVLSWFIR